jgi:hypothetical protein
MNPIDQSSFSQHIPKQEKGIFETFLDLFKRNVNEVAPPPPKKLRMTIPDDIQNMGVSNQPYQNMLFFKTLFNAFNEGQSLDLDRHLDGLIKEHGSCNGVCFKFDVQNFLRCVFSDRKVIPKKLIGQFYLYSDLIDSQEMFETIKAKIRKKVGDDFQLLAYLDGLHFGDSSQVRFLSSIFNDPEFLTSLEQFDKDFTRQDFRVKVGNETYSNIQRSEFVGIVSSFVKDEKLEKPLLNFFQQASKSYSLNRQLQHPSIGTYFAADEAFFLSKQGGKLHFGYYQTYVDKMTKKALIHYVEFTFKSDGATLVDRLENSHEHFATHFVADLENIKDEAYLKALHEKASPQMKSLLTH